MKQLNSHSPNAPAGAEPTKQSLRPEQRRLLEAMQRLRYGRIPHLPIRDGLPDLNDNLTAQRTVKVTGANTPHPAADQDDFVLRREIREFFQMLRELGDAELADLEVRNGLPCSFVVSERLGA